MADEKLAKATIAAALIQSGSFPDLIEFDARTGGARRAREEERLIEHLSVMADNIGAPEFDWRTNNMLMLLNKLTNAIYTAATEPPTPPRAGGQVNVTGV